MRIPDPIANTTTEAYLAYKAGVLSEGDLKPKLYDPYIHLDAWLAYWAGLTTTYPVKGVGKNLFDKDNDARILDDIYINTALSKIDDNGGAGTGTVFISCSPNTTYTVSKILSSRFIVGTTEELPADEVAVSGILIKNDQTSVTITTGSNAKYLCVYYRRSASDSVTKQQLLDSIQIEKGSTATAYEPYTGEPEMLTDEEALIAYLSGVTDTYPEEFRDPADVRVAAYLKYLVSARWGRPEYPVTNEELYLSMMDAPYIPAGEPSSDIEIDDTAEAPFKDVKMYGDTSQTTYTGKNLLKVPTSGTLESKGLKTTYQSDGSMVITGTPTDTWTTIKSWAGAGGIMPAGTYTISAYGTSGAKVEVQLFEGSTAHNHFVDTGAYETHTIGYSVTATTLILSNLTVGTPVNVTVRVQIEAGSSSTDYEPYVGGVPAPNPNYPQAVNTVTGRQVVKVEGKNLAKLKEGTYSWAAAGQTWEVSGDSIKTTKTNKDYQGGALNITGGSVAQWSAADAQDGKLTGNGGTYTISVYRAGEVSTKSGTTPLLRVFLLLFTDSGTRTSEIAVDLVENTSGSYTITLDNDKHIGAISLYSQYVSFEDLVVKVQLEKGSTPTDFIPYQSGEYELNLGKNLYEWNDVVWSQTVTVPSWCFQDGAGGAYGANITSKTDYKITLEAGIYYFAAYNIDSNIIYINLCADGGSSERVLASPGQAIVLDTRTTVVVRYRVTSPSLGIGNTKIQIELGSTPTSYAPYFTPIELCKIGTYQDYIYENEGKWYVHKAIGAIVFDSSSAWIKHSTTGGNVFMLNNTGFVGYAYNTGLAAPALMDTDLVGALGSSGGVSDSEYGRFGITDIRQLRVFRGAYDASYTADTFKAEMVGHYIYGVLATATDTEITNTALIDQLNALKNGGSYTGTTYIKVSATDPNLPGLLEVEAYKYD